MSTKTQSALRASLKQEDASLAERLPPTRSPRTAAKQAPGATPAQPPAKPRSRTAKTTPAGPAQAKTAPVKPARAAAVAPPMAPAATPSAAPPARQPAPPEPPRKARFTLGESEWKQLGALRDRLAQQGRRPRKSTLVRAALALFAAQPEAEAARLVDSLTPLIGSADKGAAGKPVLKHGKEKGKRKDKAGPGKKGKADRKPKR